MFSAERARTVWATWMWWVLASVAGVALTFVVTSALALAAGAVFGGAAVDKVPFVAFVGLGLGVTQWLELRGRMPKAGWWVLASAGGWVAAYATAAVAFYAASSIAGWKATPDANVLVFALALGVGVGLPQWLVLRGGSTRAGWWVAASVAGWLAAGLLIGRSVDRLLDFVWLAVIPPAFTGLVLAWLLARPQVTAAGSAPVPGH
jgi:hypothetical protein